MGEEACAFDDRPPIPIPSLIIEDEDEEEEAVNTASSVCLSSSNDAYGRARPSLEPSSPPLLVEEQEDDIFFF